MEKKKVLLAFGTHEFGLPMGNRRFFRKAVVPFLEEHSESGKKIAVIFELGYGDHMFLNRLSDEEKWLAAEQTGGWMGTGNDFIMRQLFKSEEIEKNASLAATLGSGRKGPRESTDWGINDAISEINKRRPGTVKSVVEPPPEPEAVYSLWKTDILEKRIGKAGFWTEARIQLLKEWIKHDARMIVRRDIATWNLALDLSKSHNALVIVRGAAHSGMVSLFDPEGFDLVVRTDRRYGVHFSSDAAAESYKGELTEDALLRYARLEAAYRRHLERMNPFSKAKLILYPIAPGIMKSETEKAREYAIREVESTDY